MQCVIFNKLLAGTKAFPLQGLGANILPEAATVKVNFFHCGIGFLQGGVQVWGGGTYAEHPPASCQKFPAGKLCARMIKVNFAIASFGKVGDGGIGGRRRRGVSAGSHYHTGTAFGRKFNKPGREVAFCTG